MGKLQVLLVSKDPNMYKLFSSVFRKGSPSLHLFEDTQNAFNFYKENKIGNTIVILDESINATKLQILINDLLAFHSEEQIIFLSAAPLDSICKNKVSSKITYYIDKDYLTSNLSKFPQIINYYIKKISTIKQKKVENHKKDKKVKGALQELKLSHQELITSMETLQKENQLLSQTQENLQATNQQLLAVNKKLIENEKKLQDTNRELKEKITELDFLYELSEVIDKKGASIEDILQKMAKLLSSSWDYPLIRKKIVQSITKKINILADQTAEKEKVLASEKKYRTLTENVNDIIWAMDLSLNLTYISPSITSILGYTVKEAKAKTFDNFLSPSSFRDFSDITNEELTYHQLNTTNNTCKPYRKFDCELVHKNNSTVWNEINITLTCDSEDTPTGFLVVSRDITYRKKAEEEAKFYNSLLRHNISNKNQILLGYLKLLNETQLSKVQKEYLETALQATQESNEVIHQVNKLEKIKSDYVLFNISIDPILQKTIKNYSQLAKEKDIEIIYSSKKIRVKANRLLSDAFSNIIHNALIHSQCNILTISTEINNGFCKISFVDDGKGIPDHLKENIFTRGTKGKESTGMGIGLFIVKKIIESYHGTVEIINRSAHDYIRGTILNIYIPKAKENNSSIIIDDML